MRRVLAIVGAVAMVVAAVVIRRQLDQDDAKDHERADERIVVVCAEDLLEWCETFGDEVEVRREVAVDTADALRTGALPDDVDGWVTTSAWLEVTATADEDVTAEVEVLASTPVAAASVPGPVGDAVEDLCRDRRTWDCLGEHAGASWASLGQPLGGRVTVGVTDPDTALGLPVLASIGGGTFGDLEFALNDFDDDFLSRLATLKDDADADPLRTMITRTGSYAAASGTDAAVQALDDGRVVPLALDPRVVTTVVLVRIPGADDLPSGDPVRQALRADGWAPGSGSTVPPTLKDGVMSALHQVWTEA